VKLRVVFFLASMGACAHASLDRSRVAGTHQGGVPVSDVPVRGVPAEVLWMRPECEKDWCISRESGELIAVDDQAVYVGFVGSGSIGAASLSRIPRARIKSVSLEVGPSASSEVGVWTALGCASTLSHGAYLVFTGPLWLVAGIGTAANESASSHAVAQSAHDLSQLYQFARFPQGLPKPQPPPVVPVLPASVLPPPSPLPPAPSSPLPAPPGPPADGRAPSDHVDAGL